MKKMRNPQLRLFKTLVNYNTLNCIDENSPKTTRAMFLAAEGGSPYEPNTSDAAGPQMYGHQDEVDDCLKNELPTWFAEAMVSSKLSRISFVILRASYKRSVWL